MKSAQLLYLFAEFLGGHAIAHAVNDPLHGLMIEIQELFYEIAIDEVLAFTRASFTAPGPPLFMTESSNPLDSLPHAILYTTYFATVLYTTRCQIWQQPDFIMWQSHYSSSSAESGH